jgi:hypothetical protein
MIAPSKRHVRNADQEVVTGIGAHSHEGTGAQGDLSAVTHQQIDAQRGQREDQEGNQDGAEHVLVDQEGHADEGEGNQQQHAPAVLGDREDLLVGLVGSLELSVFSVEHFLVP